MIFFHQEGWSSKVSSYIKVDNLVVGPCNRNFAQGTWAESIRFICGRVLSLYGEDCVSSNSCPTGLLSVWGCIETAILTALGVGVFWFLVSRKAGFGDVYGSSCAWNYKYLFAMPSRFFIFVVLQLFKCAAVVKFLRLPSVATRAVILDVLISTVSFNKCFRCPAYGQVQNLKDYVQSFSPEVSGVPLNVQSHDN